MNKIVPPLHGGTTGSAVADMQDALRLLLEQGALLPVLGRGFLVPKEPQALEPVLALPARERALATYGDGTTLAVQIFQQQNKLPDTGEVDDATARTLNTSLERPSPRATDSAISHFREAATPWTMEGSCWGRVGDGR
jgi:peptidoglycan hydrolase-like protein with peptidoglycan-binding domain